MIAPQTRAILWAQWRSFLNHSPMLRRSFPLAGVIMTAWYGVWVFAAAALGLAVADPESAPLVNQSLVQGLFAATLYWQVFPILMASSGASLDLRRLMVYPVERRHLFDIEVTLRVTSAIEVLLLLSGTAIGMLFNPALWKPGVLAFVPFILFNLLLASAVRDLLAQLMARKHVREVAVVVLVVLAGLPQLLIHTRMPPELGQFVSYLAVFPWPWAAAGHLALGTSTLASAAELLAWTAGAYLLARRQFDRSLREGPSERQAAERTAARQGLWEALYRVPSRIFSDPLGALIEKDVRTLSRSPRFRLVFIMGFTFGLLVWFPIGFRRDNPNWVSEHFLTVAIAYEVLLLGEVVIWNILGFDRRAAQFYFVMPVRLATVVVAKNLSAAFFILLDAALILMMCMVLGLSVKVLMVLEALSVAAVISLLLMAIGNMLSMRNARPVDPDRSWGRSSAGRVQAVLFFLYPIILAPIALAFLARHAFESEWAFYGVLGFDFAAACVVYWIALESALNTAAERREEILSALSQEGGVLAG